MLDFGGKFQCTEDTDDWGVEVLWFSDFGKCWEIVLELVIVVREASPSGVHCSEEAD